MNVREYAESVFNNKKYNDMKESDYFMYKVSFLEDSDMTEDTMRTYIRVFAMYIYKFEVALEKDLYNFNVDEVSMLMSSIATTSISLKISILSIIKSYDNWAYSKGYRNNINDLKLLENEKLIEVDSNRIKRNYISVDDTYNLASYMLGHLKPKVLDSVLLMLLTRHGLKGEELSEVFNLKHYMVDRDEKVIRYSCKEYTKEVKVDERLFYFIDEVAKLNGEYETVLEGKIVTDVLRKYIARYSKEVLKKAVGTQHLYNSCLFDELDERAEKNDNVLMIEDIKEIKKKYEPLSKASSYTTLKNTYARFNPDVTIKKAKSGMKKGVSKEANKIIAKLEL